MECNLASIESYHYLVSKLCLTCLNRALRKYGVKKVCYGFDVANHIRDISGNSHIARLDKITMPPLNVLCVDTSPDKVLILRAGSGITDYL